MPLTTSSSPRAFVGVREFIPHVGTAADFCTPSAYVVPILRTENANIALSTPEFTCCIRQKYRMSEKSPSFSSPWDRSACVCTLPSLLFLLLLLGKENGETLTPDSLPPSSTQTKACGISNKGEGK